MTSLIDMLLDGEQDEGVLSEAVRRMEEERRRVMRQLEEGSFELVEVSAEE